MELPQNYDFNISEPKWQKYWEEKRIYMFNPDSKAKIYSMDTPPPTVSGNMHIGHSFSYSQQDFMARYKRMQGFNIFYPFGTDDNGLATERLVEKENNVRSKNMSRDSFIKLCLDYLNKIRPDFVGGWKRMGISADFNIFYSTIDDHCRTISQRSFIDLYEMGREYRKEAATLWCPECQTAIGQIECEDKEIDSHFNDIVFRAGNKDLIVATTRPELLPACVALFYNPEDDRYKHLAEKKAKVPLFDIEVPLMPDKRADPSKGTGLVMCCTFGDQTDIEWQKAYNLPIKTAITVNGFMTSIAGKYANKKIKDARNEIMNDLKEKGLLIASKPIKHIVNVHERCKTPIEFINSKQWFVKYLDLREDMLKWGDELKWHPDFMKVRYDNWVKGLQWDWCISRQRYYGVPFPVWYCTKCDEPVFAKKKDLPIDPITAPCPTKKCKKCGNKGFRPEKDVMDTWATSSLTPQISTELFKKHKIFKKLFPMALRSQAHEIISFWLFNTIVKSRLHYGKNPWTDAILSGYVLGKDRQKMSKSLGNVVNPQEVIAKYGADAIRSWAGDAKLGEDIAYSDDDMLKSKKTMIKLWNATKFVLPQLEEFRHSDKCKFNSIDRWMLSRLNNTIKVATECFNLYEYSKSKFEVEQFFWKDLCDNYIEIVKERLYNKDKRAPEERAAAQYVLYNSILAILKMEAPFMPHVTEEIYHLFFAEQEKKESIHLSHWPKFNRKEFKEKDMELGKKIVEIISAARKAKAEKKVSLKTEITDMIIECNAKLKKAVQESMDDIKASTVAKQVRFGNAETELSEGLKVRIILSENKSG